MIGFLFSDNSVDLVIATFLPIGVVLRRRSTRISRSFARIFSGIYLCEVDKLLYARNSVLSAYLLRTTSHLLYGRAALTWGP